jgi:predicted transcriptional regulator
MGKTQVSLTLDLFEKAGTTGYTTSELEQITGIPHQSQSARVNALAQQGFIVKTVVQRRTALGRLAYVYVHHAFERQVELFKVPLTGFRSKRRKKVRARS